MSKNSDAQQLDDHHPVGDLMDYTEWLMSTSSDLAIGSVVRSGSLTLFDAMIAIEIFADRMDSGLVTHADLRTPPHDDTFLAELAHFSPAQVSSTLILLFRAFSTYVAGAGTLSNTIFTSIFVRSAAMVPCQERLGPEALRIFAFSLVRCSFHFVNLFSRLGLYEEEDFSLEQASLDLLDGLDDSALLTKLETLINRLPDAEQSDEIAAAKPLIRFIQSLLVLLARLGSLPHFNFGAAVDRLSQAVSMWQASASHADFTHGADNDTDDQSAWDLGFDPRALRHLTIHCPPRNAPWMSLADSCNLWNRISKQTAAVAQLQTGPRLSSSGLLSIIEHATGWEQAPRSILHLVLFAQSGMVNGRLYQEFMREWLLEITGAPFASAPSAVDVLVAGCVRASVQGNVSLRSGNAVRSLEAEIREQLQHLSHLMYCAVEPVMRNAFRAFVHNAARTRRLLFKVCQQLAALECSADSVDAEIAAVLNQPALARYFVHWVGYLKDRWALLQLDLGRRLDLFACHEQHSVLFVHTVLTKSLRDRVHALHDCHLAALTLLSPPPVMNKPKTKKRPAKSSSVPLFPHVGTSIMARASKSAFLKAELASAELRFAIAAVSMSLFFLTEPLPDRPSLLSLLGMHASVPDRSTLFHQRFRHWERFMSATTPISFLAMHDMYQEQTMQPAETLAEATKTLTAAQSLLDAATPSISGACDAAKAVLELTEVIRTRASELNDALCSVDSVLGAVVDALQPDSSMPACARSKNKRRGRDAQREMQRKSRLTSPLDTIRAAGQVTLTWSPNYCIGLLAMVPHRGVVNQDLTVGVRGMSIRQDPLP